VTSLSLYEDLLAPDEVLTLTAGARIVYVASGELASLHAGTAVFGTDEAELRAGKDGATVLRWELTEWSVDDAKLTVPVELDPWGDYALRCERDGGRSHRQGIGCVLRGELLVDGERVQPFGAFAQPADVYGQGSHVRVVLERAETPLGDALAQDLTTASIGGDAKTITFQIGLNSLPPSGGIPEITRYVWSLQVDGNYVELDGKFTNYSRGACDPTSGQCPPPRDPGMYPFLIRGNCTSVEGQSVTTCEELGIVSATFDTATATIQIPVPASLIKAKPGSKITVGNSTFTTTAGGPIVAIPSAFVSNTASPMDTMQITGTFVVPKK